MRHSSFLIKGDTLMMSTGSCFFHVFAAGVRLTQVGNSAFGFAKKGLVKMSIGGGRKNVCSAG